MIVVTKYMKIIDTTTYFEEKMMMDIRLNILDQFVDKFIVCEARFTHSGKEKEIKFNKKDFPKFEEKITHIILDKEPSNIIKKENLNSLELRLNSVLRIKEQRNYIGNSLKDYSSEDYVIHSDNDEIPDLQNFNLRENKQKFVIFNQKLFYYKFNLSLPNIDWFGSKACKLKNLKNIDLLRATKNRKYPFYRVDIFFSPIKHQSVNLVSDGGWHFSNLKNVEELERKFLNDENHSEYETQGYSVDRIKENIKNKSIDYNHQAKQDSTNRFNATKLQLIDFELLPNYIKKNFEKYKNWFD
jgi:beta-1,4-mannosyl-glycoprotein beta-1,4-N-acetylglucosaminyltransferase